MNETVVSSTEVPIMIEGRNLTTETPWELPYTTAWVVVPAFLIFTMMIFGAVANIITIIVIRKSSKLRTKFYTLIMSLCVSDLTSALLSPLFLYRRTWGFEYFALPNFFCKFYWGVDYWTSYATALHILSFALLRFIGVQWPHVFRRINGKHIVIWLVSIWFVAFGGGLIPHVIFNEVKVIDRSSHDARWASCSLAEHWFETWQQYIKYAYPIFLYAPAALVIVFSVAIGIRLTIYQTPGDNNNRTTSTESCRRSASRQKKDRHIIIQLMLIVGSFLFGYIPVTAFHWYTGFTLEENDPVTNKIDWQFAMIQYLLLRFSECLNPVFYNLASRKMRKETMKLIRLCFCRQTAPGTPAKSRRTTGTRQSSNTTSSV